ncbi:MAG: hypothetical protein KAJ19_14405 [Gammaproteobacteria bacterium]|nr:hypothetical protein [Gammaproteobacteria bacterium]
MTDTPDDATDDPAGDAEPVTPAQPAQPAQPEPLAVVSDILIMAKILNVTVASLGTDEEDEVADAIKDAGYINGVGSGETGREAMLAVENDSLKQAIMIASPVVQRHKLMLSQSAKWLNATHDRIMEADNKLETANAALSTVTAAGVVSEQEVARINAELAKWRRRCVVVAGVLSAIATLLGIF